MPPKIPSPLPVDLEGNVKLGVKTLIALLIAVVTCTITLVSVLPTKSDLVALFERHDKSADSHPKKTETLDNVEDKVVAVDSRLGKLEENQIEDRKAVGYIRARIDFLTEQAVREKAPSKWAGNQAVKKLRSGAKPSDVIDE